jgi:hypothetical protein
MLRYSICAPKPCALDSCDLHAMAALTLYSGWRQLCVHVQPCVQGLGDAACLLCMLGAVTSYSICPSAMPCRNYCAGMGARAVNAEYSAN